MNNTYLILSVKYVIVRCLLLDKKIYAFSKIDKNIINSNNKIYLLHKTLLTKCVSRNML